MDTVFSPLSSSLPQNQSAKVREASDLEKQVMRVRQEREEATKNFAAGLERARNTLDSQKANPFGTSAGSYSTQLGSIKKECDAAVRDNSYERQIRCVENFSNQVLQLLGWGLDGEREPTKREVLAEFDLFKKSFDNFIAKAKGTAPAFSEQSMNDYEKARKEFAGEANKFSSSLQKRELAGAYKDYKPQMIDVLSLLRSAAERKSSPGAKAPR